MEVNKAELVQSKNISTLLIQVWLDTYAQDGIREVFAQYIWENLTPEKIEKKIASGSSEFYNLIIDHHLVGVAEINYSSPCPSDKSITTEIEKFYLIEKYCNKGIGRIFLNQIEFMLGPKKVPALWLSVLESNKRAIKFYKKNSFIENGVLYFELGSEKHKNLIMTKKLL